LGSYSSSAYLNSAGEHNEQQYHASVGCMTALKTHDTYLQDLFGVHKDAIVPLEPYINSWTEIPHRCSKGHEWMARPNTLLSGKGCQKCYHESLRKSHKQYCKEVQKVHGDKIIPAEEYVTSGQAINHRCKQGHIWKANPSMILLGHGCPVCNTFMTHEFFIHNRRYIGQGYEEYALKQLIYKEKWEHPVSRENIPRIPYKFAGRKRIYTPDAFFPKRNLILEVKSTWTLGLVGELPGCSNPLGEIKAKRRGCLAQGFNFELMLMSEKYRYPLPEDWYGRTKSSLIQYLGL
jgi:hypothetical protein